MGSWFSALFGYNNRVLIGDQHYRVIRRIGEGSYSNVDLVTDRERNQLALKRIPIVLPDLEEAVRHEIHAHSQLIHPNILRLVNHDLTQRGNNAHPEARLITDFYPHGTIQSWIERIHHSSRTPRQLIPESNILSITVSICNALNFMHHHIRPGLAHRDLKPDNLLLNHDRSEAVIMDLGSVQPAIMRITCRQQALIIQDKATQETTSTYRAPELFDPPVPGQITGKVDLWSLGCTMYAMAYGDSPFDGTIMGTLSGRVKFPIPREGETELSHRFTEMLLNILKVDASERPEVLELATMLEHIVNA